MVSLVAILWACFLLRGVFYSLLFPLWEGFDEYAHFAYVQHLVEEGRIPAGIRTPVSREVAESLSLAPMPFTLEGQDFRVTTHDAWWRLSGEERARRARELLGMPPGWAREPAGSEFPLYEAQQPPLYYWLASWPYRVIRGLPLPNRVLILRLCSVAAASFFVPLAFLAARRVLGSGNAAAAALAVMVCVPELQINLARVGNEGPALVLFSLLFFAVLAAAERPDARLPWLAAGAALGLGLLTKAYFLTALPAFALSAAWILTRAKARRGRAAWNATAALLLALALASGWYLRTWQSTGSLSGLMQAVELRDVPMAELIGMAPRVNWLEAADSTFFSHIWFGGWSFLQMRWWIYRLFRYLAWACVLGLLVVLWRCLRMREPGSMRCDATVLLSAFFGCFLAGLAFHVLITYAAKGISSSAGWYACCLVVAEVLLAAVGLGALSPVRARRWLLPGLAVVFALLDFYGTHFLLVPYYAGVIAHNPNGALATLHLPRLADFGFEALARRLGNEGMLGVTSGAMVAGWLLYVAATLTAVAVSARTMIGAGQRANPSAVSTASSGDETAM